MKVWDEMYGDDADGNRGVMTTFSELDDSPEEREQIIEKLVDIFKEDWCLSLDGAELELHDDCGEGEYKHDVETEVYAAEVISILRGDDEGDDIEYTLALRDFEVEYLKVNTKWAEKRLEKSDNFDAKNVHRVMKALNKNLA